MAKAKEKTKKSGGSLGKIKLIILFIGLFAILKQASIFFIIGMLPTIVSNITDRSQNRMVLKIVGCFNLAGILPYLIDTLNAGPNSSSLETMLFNANVWLAVYGFAALGYGLILFMPSVVILFIGGMHQSKSAELQEKQRKLLEEWGPELKRGE